MQSKNDRAERAKMFLPFDALKGLREALREKEKVIVEKKELSEDQKAFLSNQLTKVKKLTLIKIIYYNGMEYEEIEGLVSKIDLEYEHCLYIQKQKICFSDIIEIQADYLEDVLE